MPLFRCAASTARQRPASRTRKLTLACAARSVPMAAGVRVHDVRDDGGSGAGVRDRAGRRARAAVDQALQHLHPLLRADRRQSRARDAGRRGNRRPLRRLRAQRLPPLLAAAGDLRRRALALWAQGVSWAGCASTKNLTLGCDELQAQMKGDLGYEDGENRVLL